MKFKLIRKATIAGAQIVYHFDQIGSKFLIKNFTEGDIYVRFCEGEENPILIPVGCAQVCVISEGPMYWRSISTDTVYVTAEESNEKGVEVQCLKW